MPSFHRYLIKRQLNIADEVITNNNTQLQPRKLYLYTILNIYETPM